MFITIMSAIALCGAFWETLRVGQAKKRSFLQLFLIYLLFVFIWVIPVLIRDRGPFSGVGYTFLHHTLYFIFILNFFYTLLIVLRDFFWIIGWLWRKIRRKEVGFYNWCDAGYIRRTGYIALILAGLLALIAQNAGMRIPAVKETVIPVQQQGIDFKIVALNDLHLHRTLSVNKIQAIVQQVNALNPDLIVFAGDTVDDYANQIEPHLNALKLLNAKKGKFAVLGNHEFYVGYEATQRALETADIKPLFNEGLFVDKGIYLAGIPDFRSVSIVNKKADSEQALKTATQNDFKILLSHRPDFIKKLQKGQIDLQISGHTHGGQIFPMHIPVLYMNGYLSGLYEKEQGLLYVSSGSGQWGPQMRLFAPSEITVIHLVSSQEIQSADMEKTAEKEFSSILEKEDLKEESTKQDEMFEEEVVETNDMTQEERGDLSASEKFFILEQTENEFPSLTIASSAFSLEITPSDKADTENIQAFEEAKAGLDAELADILNQKKKEQNLNKQKQEIVQTYPVRDVLSADSQLLNQRTTEVGEKPKCSEAKKVKTVVRFRQPSETAQPQNNELTNTALHLAQPSEQQSIQSDEGQVKVSLPQKEGSYVTVYTVQTRQPVYYIIQPTQQIFTTGVQVYESNKLNELPPMLMKTLQ